jgi:RNA polymerase sigma-70 factor (ECF subfamily)
MTIVDRVQDLKCPVSSLANGCLLRHETGTMDDASSGQSSEFPKTRWSLVLAAGGSDAARRQSALEEICRQYWYPLYAYVRRRGASPEDAQDITQGFFEQMLESQVIERLGGADKGKLRCYLLTSMQNWMTKQHHKNKTLRRGSGKVFSMDSLSAEERYLMEPTHSDTPERLYERRWALMVLEQAIARLQADYDSAGKGELAALLIPLLSRGEAKVSMADLATRAGVSEGHARVLLHRIRKHFRAALIEVIAETVEGEAEVAEELRHLQVILMN